MPERDDPLDERDRPIEGGTSHRGNRDFGPDHVDIHAAHFRGNPEAHADDGGSEEFRHDRADEQATRGRAVCGAPSLLPFQPLPALDMFALSIALVEQITQV